MGQKMRTENCSPAHRCVGLFAAGFFNKKEDDDDESSLFILYFNPVKYVIVGIVRSR